VINQNKTENKQYMSSIKRRYCDLNYDPEIGYKVGNYDSNKEIFALTVFFTIHFAHNIQSVNKDAIASRSACEIDLKMVRLCSPLIA